MQKIVYIIFLGMYACWGNSVNAQSSKVGVENPEELVQITSFREARKQTAQLLADTFAMPAPKLKLRASNSLFNREMSPMGATALGGIPAPKNETKTATNMEDVVAFSDFLQAEQKKYQLRLTSVNSDTVPDVFQYDLRSELYYRIGMLKSSESLIDAETGELVWTTDATGHRILAYPLAKLRKNPRYGLIENYKEGFARIKKDQVFGFLNVAGLEKVPHQYEKALPFNDGKAMVKKQDWFFINHDGEESEILTNITDAQSLKWGYWIAEFRSDKKAEPKYAIIDNNYQVNKKLRSKAYDNIEHFYQTDYLLVQNQDKYGLIKISGEVWVEPTLDKIEPTKIQGLLKVALNRKVGLMDTTGRMKVQPVFDNIGEFNEHGLAVAQSNNTSILIRKADFRASQAYSSIGVFDELGYAVIQNLDKKYGIINQDFTEIIPPTYASLGSFNANGLAVACKIIGQCGFVNKQGQEVIPTLFEEIGKFNSIGFAIAKQRINCGGTKDCVVDVVIDMNGKIVIDKNDVSPENFHYQISDTLLYKFVVVRVFPTGKSEVSDKVMYHLINKELHEKITSEAFHAIRGYDRNFMFMVNKNNSWGMMDTTGRMITKCQFKEIMNPSEGLYGVRSFENNKFGFIDKKGKLQVPYEYEQVLGFNSGIAIASKGVNRWGLISRFNAKVVPCQFKSIQYIEAQKIELTEPNNEKYYVNTQGDCLENCSKFYEILKKANQDTGN